jgi:hypothetical protein
MLAVKQIQDTHPKEASGTKVAEVFILVGLYRTQNVGQLATIIEDLGNRAA